MRAIVVVAVAAISIAAPTACKEKSARVGLASASVGGTMVESGGPSTASSPAPLDAHDPLVALEVLGFGDAVVSLPLGATSPRPVVVVAHGYNDWPEAQCEVWRSILANRGFVLCPRGARASGGQPAGFQYFGAPALADEVDAALHALRERYGGYVDDGPIVFAGFSQGASFGVGNVLRDPARFSRAVFTEGGEEGWTSAAAKLFADRGGTRVLFACGLRARVAAATVAAQRLESVGVAAKVLFGKPPDREEFMHGYDGPVAEAIAGEFEWLVEGDPRWKR